MPLPMTMRRLALVVLSVASLGPTARAQAPAHLQFSEQRVRPALVEHCQKCHGPEKQKGHLRLDSRASVLKGGDSGAALVPREPAKSLMLKAVGYGDPE